MRARSRGEARLAPPRPLADCDRGTIESALSAPGTGWGADEKYPDLASKAAALLYALAKSQAPDGVFAVIQGTLVVRLLLHTTETGLNHSLSFEIVDEDGQQIANASGDFRVERNVGLPIGWDQSANFVFPLTGIPLAKPGNYTINLRVGDELLGDRPFRVLKLY